MNGETKDDKENGVKFLENDQKEETRKRLDYICWDDYFMSIAILSAQRSKDPNTQVGACIVDEDRKIVGIGYNGMPIGCSDDELPWKRKTEDNLDNKSFYVCHAEMNAIMNSISRNLKKCKMYTTHFPCNECGKLIIQSGIKNIVYCHDKLEDQRNLASKRMFDITGITYTKFEAGVSKILLTFDSDDVKCVVSHKKSQILCK